MRSAIDVGARDVYVALSPDPDPEPVRMFSTFTVELERLAAWLHECGVNTAAMESTGVYWIPLCDILEAHGVEVCLAHVCHISEAVGS